MTISSEGESMTQKWEAIQRLHLSGEALPHFEFQKDVARALVDLSRMVRDLARATHVSQAAAEPIATGPYTVQGTQGRATNG